MIEIDPMNDFELLNSISIHERIKVAESNFSEWRLQDNEPIHSNSFVVQACLAGDEDRQQSDEKASESYKQ